MQRPPSSPRRRVRTTPRCWRSSTLHSRRARRSRRDSREKRPSFAPRLPAFLPPTLARCIVDSPGPCAATCSSSGSPAWPASAALASSHFSPTRRAAPHSRRPSEALGEWTRPRRADRTNRRTAPAAASVTRACSDSAGGCDEYRRGFREDDPAPDSPPCRRGFRRARRVAGGSSGTRRARRESDERDARRHSRARKAPTGRLGHARARISRVYSPRPRSSSRSSSLIRRFSPRASSCRRRSSSSRAGSIRKWSPRHARRPRFPRGR